jgi:hypothetical protein
VTVDIANDSDSDAPERCGLAVSAAPIGWRRRSGPANSYKSISVAWSCRLLHAQGPSAVVRPPDEEQMSADGMTAADIAEVQDHLAMLRINSLVPTRRGILQDLFRR